MNAKSISLIAIVFALAASHPAAADDTSTFRQPHPNFYLLPPQPQLSQHIYSEYQARWWQWATSLPADHNPLLDTAPGTAGQSGSVWYIGGVYGEGAANRTLTVPFGKALFFPVINLAYFLTDPSDTEEGSRELINTIMDYVVYADTFVEIDGRRVANLGRFRTESRLFNVGPLPANNLPGTDAGRVVPTVDDGIYLMLLPLTPGWHTIRFAGHVRVPAEVPVVGGYEFSQDATYHITVQPWGR